MPKAPSTLPEIARSPFSLFRRPSPDNPGQQRLTGLTRAVGAAAFLALAGAAACGDAYYEPNGRRLGGSAVTADSGGHDGPDGGPPKPDARERTDSGERFDGNGRFDGGGPDGRDGRSRDDGGREDSGPRGDAGRRADGGPPDGRDRDAGGDADAGRGPDAGSGPDGGTPPDCPAETCREGVGACEQAGNVLYNADCNPTGCSVSGAKPADSEDCSNPLDDDCDGEVNDGCACVPGETAACYSGGEDTRNRGACHDGDALCGADGQLGPCEGQQTPTEEMCGNGIDEDCDLETNEGCGGGVECASGEGVCRTQGLTRADGSCDAVPSAPEETDLCGDGLDNDCINGIDDGCVCPADNTQLCYQGSAATLNIGACRPGTQTCIDGRRWSAACEGQILPSAEQCNGLNDDCDTDTDEGIASRPCSTVCGAGTEVCRDGAFRDCNAPAPQTETCNGADDDCDAGIDEEIAPRSCSSICGAGTEVCRDGAFRDCNAPTPQPETCNGTDDNCDGATDEGCPCTAGRGICERSGTVQPDGICDVVAGVAGIEICNGADDDCDGETDETFPEQDQPCTVGQGICENSGFVVCDDPALGAHCNVLPGTPSEETCNGTDDDCDNVTDEGCLCTVGRGICERPGVIGEDGSCVGTPGDPALEVCNGTDDDCDGLTDETFPEEGPCTVGTGACARSGTMLCEPGSPLGDTHCSVVAGDPSSEICGGGDEDCDGFTNEENAGGCSSFFRDADADTYGTTESRCLCAADGEFTASRSGDCADGNAAVNPAAAEVVNSGDDDCDIWIDESSAGYDVMCDDTGGSANVTPNGQPAHACSPGGEGLRPEMVSIPADVVSSAVYNTRFGADGQRRAVLVTLVPGGAPDFNSIAAQNTATGTGLSVGLTACPADLPVAPPGRETRCYRSPDEPGGIDTPVRFNITP